MKEKKAKICGKWERVPEGVSLIKKHGKEKLIVRWIEQGKQKSKIYPATKEGLEDAKKKVETMRRESVNYGQKFGAISDDEKRALDLWRSYVKACQREACTYLDCSEVMKIALEQVRPQSITPLFPEMANEWLKMMERKETSPEHLRKRADKVRRFSAYFQGVRAGNITPEAVQVFLDTLQGRNGGKPAPRTVQDYMVCLGHIFSYGVKRGMVKKNPLDAMDKPQVKPEGEPETITTADAQKILEYACSYTACRPYLPALLLALFCGIRPAELGRMKYKDLFLGDRAVAYLSRAITKTNVDRLAKIRSNLAAWLNYTAKSGLHGARDAFILPGETEKKRSENYTRNLKRVATGAGVTIPRDALRHTAATMICALDGMADAAEELGNDKKTLQKHYRHAVTKDEAQAFFGIMPPED